MIVCMRFGCNGLCSIEKQCLTGVRDSTNVLMAYDHPENPPAKKSPTRMMFSPSAFLSRIEGIPGCGALRSVNAICPKQSYNNERMRLGTQETPNFELGTVVDFFSCLILIATFFQ